MKWTFSLYAALALSCAASVAAGDENLLDQVSSDGAVSGELAKRTGWKSLRGVRWRILVPSPADGSRIAMSPRETFASGQRFQVEIEAHVCDVWVYLLALDPGGELVVLFPEKGEEHRKIPKRRKVLVPPSPDWLVFGGQAGTDILRIVASPKPLDWMNPRELIESEAGTPMGSAGADLARGQKSIRTKQLSSILGRQQESTVRKETLRQTVRQLEENSALRARQKNVVILPPPADSTNDGSQRVAPGEALIASGEAGDTQSPAIIDIELTHR